MTKETWFEVSNSSNICPLIVSMYLGVVFRRRENYFLLLKMIFSPPKMDYETKSSYILREPQNFAKSSPLFCPTYLVPVKSKMKISQNVVAFSEYMNFKHSRPIFISIIGRNLSCKSLIMYFIKNTIFTHFILSLCITYKFHKCPNQVYLIKQ